MSAGKTSQCFALSSSLSTSFCCIVNILYDSLLTNQSWIYIFYSWMRHYTHWPIRQQQTMSQSRGDNRSKIYVIFSLDVPPFRIFNIYYRISSNRSPQLVLETRYVFETRLLLEEIRYIFAYTLKYFEVGCLCEKMHMAFTGTISPWLWQLPALVQPV